jgi:hypothetical protein
MVSIVAFITACVALVAAFTYQPDQRGVDQREFDRVVAVLQADLQRHEAELARLRHDYAAAKAAEGGK